MTNNEAASIIAGFTYTAFNVEEAKRVKEALELAEKALFSTQPVIAPESEDIAEASQYAVDRSVRLMLKKHYLYNAEKEAADREKRFLMTAFAALEMRVPKKPLPEERYYGNGQCPCCNAVFLDKSTNFCGNCGQALDWGTGK